MNLPEMNLPDGLAFKVFFDPAWDKRATEPSLGQHYAQFRFALTGPAGAVTWVLFTGWSVESAERGPIRTEPSRPIPAELYRHWRVPAGTTGARECEYVGGWCLEAGFMFTTDHVYKAFVLQGYDGLAAVLLEHYNEMLTEGPSIATGLQ